MISNGHDVCPLWARGCKILVPGLQVDDLEEVVRDGLGKRHVIIFPEKERELHDVFWSSLPYNSRPRLKAGRGIKWIPYSRSSEHVEANVPRAGQNAVAAAVQPTPEVPGPWGHQAVAEASSSSGECSSAAKPSFPEHIGTYTITNSVGYGLDAKVRVRVSNTFIDVVNDELDDGSSERSIGRASSKTWPQRFHKATHILESGGQSTHLE